MKHAHRLKLLFGPCRPSPLKRGDRAFCLFRDGTVFVTSWTDARIPWPRCRPWTTVSVRRIAFLTAVV